VSGFALNGAHPDEGAGVAVSGVGDVNGDGIDDLIVGAHGTDIGGFSRAGASCVVFGRHGLPCGSEVSLRSMAPMDSRCAACRGSTPPDSPRTAQVA
jgi:hypothetical protein